MAQVPLDADVQVAIKPALQQQDPQPIVQPKFERKDQHDNQIKSKQLSPPIRRQKRSSSTQDTFHSFIDTKIGYHFSDDKNRINLLLSFSLCYTILAAMKANIKCRKRIMTVL